MATLGLTIQLLFQEKYLKALDETSSAAASAAPAETGKAKVIGGDNLGNKMLQRMGWKEGLGLGKSNQGRTSIIEVSKTTS